MNKYCYVDTAFSSLMLGPGFFPFSVHEHEEFCSLFQPLVQHAF